MGDHGDLQELYRPLDEGSRIAMKEWHPAPRPSKATFSTNPAGPQGTVRRGPVFLDFSVTHPFGEDGHFSTRVRLFAGLRRIEFHTRVLNNEATGVSAEGVRVKLSVPVIVAEEVNLMEDPRRTLSVANGTVQLGLRAFEIKTVRLGPGRFREARPGPRAKGRGG